VNVQAASMMRVLSLPADFFKSYSSGELSQYLTYMNSLCNTLVDSIFSTAITGIFSLVYLTQIFSYARALVVPSLLVTVITLALSMAVYLLLNLLPQAMCDVRQVELRVEERSIILPAMLDSGNLLRDPITNLPVLVIPARAARTLFPDLNDPSSLTELPLGFRLLSVRTAAGSALLPMFRPDECRIYVNGRACKAQLLAAVAGQEYRGVQALVPMAALPA